MSIDIIVPVYNTERYLRRCLDSLIYQTFFDTNIICVDDGSTDNSLQILKEYEKRYPKVKVFSQENKGLSSARNLGLENSSSEFVMFCDSDDYYYPNMCKEMRRVLADYDADIAVCDISLVYQPGIVPLDRFSSYFKLNFEGVQEIENIVLQKTNVSVCNKIYKRSIIDAYDIKFPVGLKFEDNFFFISYMSVANNIYFLHKPLYNYYRHTESIMGKVLRNKVTEDVFDLFRVFEKIYEFLEKNNRYNKFQRAYWKLLCANFLDVKKKVEHDVLKQELERINKCFFSNFDIEEVKKGLDELYWVGIVNEMFLKNI